MNSHSGMMGPGSVHGSSGHTGHSGDHSEHNIDALHIVAMVFAPLIVIENVITFLAVTRVRNMYLTLKILLLNLNLGDTLLGFFFWLSNFLGYTEYGAEDTGLCYFRVISVIYLMLVVLSVATCISLERFLSLYRPFDYARLSSNRNLILVTVVIWLLPAVIIISAFSGEEIDVSICHVISRRTFITLATARGVQIVVICASQLMVFRLAKAQVTKIGQQVTWTEKKATMSRLNQKLTFATQVAIIPYLIMCVPHICLTISMAVGPSRVYDSDWHKAMSAAWFICVIHGLIHPLTYCWALKSIRRQAFRGCRRCCGDDAVDEDSATATDYVPPTQTQTLTTIA
ncbi:uncharacterized protein LOC101858758 [Aplysia californica]|uniref:Uncharacterized protein LOC101858758 n=1 Tax=Aplysia californica TaxID=6500 RepID=A0ABM0JBU6_APLCA|nr:uncharacterized protein LOC101858758 [Aplysia californica]